MFRPIALEEAIEAKAWYRAQAGLGDVFADDLEHALDLVIEYPGIGLTVSSRGARRVLLRRFPYALFYVIRRDALVVLAVFHVSRDPKRLRGRLK